MAYARHADYAFIPAFVPLHTHSAALQHVTRIYYSVCLWIQTVLPYLTPRTPPHAEPLGRVDTQRRWHANRVRQRGPSDELCSRSMTPQSSSVFADKLVVESNRFCHVTRANTQSLSWRHIVKVLCLCGLTIIWLVFHIAVVASVLASHEVIPHGPQC